MIDSSFLKEEDIDEKFLRELKESVDEFFNEIEIRV